MSANAAPTSAAIAQHIILGAGNNPRPHRGVSTQTTKTLSCISSRVKTMTPKLARAEGTATTFSTTLRHLPIFERSRKKKTLAPERKTRPQMKPETTPPTSKRFGCSTTTSQNIFPDSRHQGRSPVQLAVPKNSLQTSRALYCWASRDCQVSWTWSDKQEYPQELERHLAAATYETSCGPRTKALRRHWLIFTKASDKGFTTHVAGFT
mmetsp:Transcript_7796/g.18735  ORF Transcript_7796/g.18735 Transcript_7796/m.18735 type:complete len:208 (+) Transcript_7796:1172-1795(+)